eukprot:gene4655-6542_t
MTYTTKNKTIIKTASYSNYKLWKISNHNNNKLNKQPVLFIPGHKGNPDQVRSLSSPLMHNEDQYFQYFSVDFNYEPTAVHGYYIYNQAVFVNEVLKKIQNLYKRHSQKDSDYKIKVIVIGHSIGGMVARTSLLLNSYPKCSVSDIVLLSSPNIRAPYVPDSSMDVLYNSINKAWLLSYYNMTLSNLEDIETIGNEKLKTNSLNPKCVPHTRLLSITGGEIDLEVDPELTNLFELAPRPRNSTLIAESKPTKSKTLGLPAKLASIAFETFASPVKLIVQSAYQIVKMVSGNGKSVNSNNTKNDTISKQNSSTNDSLHDTVVVDVSEKTCFDESGKASDSNSCSNLFENISSNSSANDTIKSSDVDLINAWNQHVIPYIEPKYLSIRTSQMKRVGFPIDHTAILWCHQLIDSITQAMKILSESSIESNPLTAEFGIFSLQQYATDFTYETIPAKRLFLERNESNYNWKKSQKIEYEYIRKTLGSYSLLMILPVTYFNSHLIKIMVCYLIISCFTILSYQLRALANHKESILFQLNTYKLLLPKQHLSLSLLISAVIYRLVQLDIPHPLIQVLMKSFIPIVVICLLVKMFVLDFLFGGINITSYSSILFWLISYFLAIGFRFLFIITFTGLRYIFATLNNLFYSIARYTIWSKYIRRPVKKGIKSIQSLISMPLTNVFLTLIIGIIWGIVYINSSDRLYSPVPLDRSVYGLSIISIVGFIIMSFLLLIGLIIPPKGNEKDEAFDSTYHFYNELLLLYAPAPFLALPSFLFSYHLLFGDLEHISESVLLFSIFGPERIHFCLALVFISFHLFRARNKKNSCESVEPIGWLEDLFGPAIIEATKHIVDDPEISSDQPKRSNAFFANLASIAQKSGSKNSSCVHEDGGKDSIFEKVDAISQGLEYVEVTPGVILGSTYRVIYCNCVNDKSLKDRREYCEWCQCRKCGGKNLPREYDNNSSVTTDISIDLIPFMALIGIIIFSFLFLALKPYRYLYFLGVVAGCHCLKAIIPKRLRI